MDAGRGEPAPSDEDVQLLEGPWRESSRSKALMNSLIRKHLFVEPCGGLAVLGQRSPGISLEF